MWWNILPGAIVIGLALATPHMIVAPISHWLIVGNFFRRSLNTRNDRRQYLRDLRLTGNPYTVWGLDEIPDEPEKRAGEGEDELSEVDKCKLLLEAQALEDALNREKCPVEEGLEEERVCKKDRAKQSEPAEAKPKVARKAVVEPADPPKPPPTRKSKCAPPEAEGDSGPIVVEEEGSTCKMKPPPAGLSDVSADPAKHSVEKHKMSLEGVHVSTLEEVHTVVYTPDDDGRKPKDAAELGDSVKPSVGDHDMNLEDLHVDTIQEVQSVIYTPDKECKKPKVGTDGTPVTLAELNADPTKRTVEGHDMNMEDLHVDTVEEVTYTSGEERKRKCPKKGEEGARPPAVPITKQCEKFNVDEPVELTSDEQAELDAETKKCQPAPFVPPRTTKRKCRKESEPSEE